MNWAKVEIVCQESLPSCLKKILSWSGYNTILSLQAISSESISRIEKHVNSHCLGMIQQLDCCYSEFYKEREVFEFLPGHQDLLLAVSKVITDQSIQDSHSGHDSNDNVKYSCDLIENIQKHCDLSTIMKELMQTALRNGKVHKNHAQYSDKLRFFATYIFLLCGRSCYKVLYENLPLPSISTVCKYFYRNFYATIFK